MSNIDQNRVIDFAAALRARMARAADEQMALMESLRQLPGMTETARWKRIVALDRYLATLASRLDQGSEFSRKGAKAQSSEVENV